MTRAFAATFGEMVTPDLERLCRVQGYFVALEIVTFEEAVGIALREATRRGALFLPHGLLMQLEDWIHIQILKYEAEARPSVLETRAVSDKVWNDLQPWFRRWAQEAEGA